ncbi:MULTISPECIES: protein translocase subunit SecF [unclassified Marinobacterium]|jgi:preprotein translocase subunit SecF|uniref:protein translocase subunit SecF n=1 Tax=unclassified Marinobacterium TaxID=2644139 RepID=UPI001569CC9B|nr:MULTISPECIES: protein translocase subunit SecF [unclassified Marinobacterium]NRP35314.1 preprotein translocase subunit SecF [Marinobacterium sp. xm-d-579]NRP53660.1 preprotein translocase subunit SecF [Marinobacterium sp. xm-v-242]NRP78158.1 preprotein translocase subunit SecF [Marinobacterium sp. xm-m-383]NRQ02988.1 preprotein translocase subunit SecF [Marinobacterium sp. xm-d-530]
MSEVHKLYNFMGLRKALGIFSIVLMIASVASLAVNGLRFGLDFTGGSLVEVGYEESADLNLIRQQLSTAGYEDAVVQNFGSSTDVLIRLGETHDPKLGDKVVEALKADGSAVELRRNEYVGAQVGEELREQGGLGMLLALAMIMVYLAFRFQFKFSLGAVLALVHDVTIVLGFFSIMQLDFDLTVLAAVLAVIGYSLNDTIVVYDRIRENFRIMRKGGPLEIMNSSLSQTLSRTLVTSLTTALVLVALLVFGGETIRGFAIALLAGVVIGTYSSIYVAANLLLALKITKEDLIPPPKEESEIDEMP